MTSIFAKGKNAGLAQLITDNPTNSYEVVDAYLKSNIKFFRGYTAFRQKAKMPFAKRNAIIWELINMVNDPDDGDDFEA